MARKKTSKKNLPPVKRQYINPTRPTFAPIDSRPLVPAQDPEMVVASRISAVYIFNVGPWPFSAQCGSMGTFRIPAAIWPTEAHMITIPGFPGEPYLFPDGYNPKGQSWKWIYHRPASGKHSPGMDFALQVVYSNRAFDKWPEQSSAQGVFSSYSKTPPVSVFLAARHRVLIAASERIKDLARSDDRDGLKRPKNDYDRKCAQLLNIPKAEHGEYEAAISAKEIDQLLEIARREVL